MVQMAQFLRPGGLLSLSLLFIVARNFLGGRSEKVISVTINYTPKQRLLTSEVGMPHIA